MAGDLVRGLHAKGLITAAHDLSDGGLAVRGRRDGAGRGHLGVAVEAHGELEPANWFFGEDQGRYLVACREEDASALVDMAIAAHMSVRRVGVTGGNTVRLGASEVALADLQAAHEGGFAAMMGEA